MNIKECQTKALNNIMKLSQYAKQNSISYQTAWNHFKAGLIHGACQLESCTVVVSEQEANKEQPVIINIFIVGDELIKESVSNE